MKPAPHIWQKADWITALLAAAISFAVYAWSAAPNVTLLDSGEFLVAAQHFGVPHPTGYPLWTLLAWIFQLLPLGNAAWEIAIFSGVCAALAVGLCAALLSNIQTWCFDQKLTGRKKWLPQIVALAFSLMLAFSQSMWSQAVIAEVYALHALLVVVFLMLCYTWVRNPARDSLMLLAFFVLAFAFGNHHLILTLAPLPYLLILLLRRRMFLDWFFAGLLTILLGYLSFAILSQDIAVLKTAIRFFYCVALAFGVFVWLRKSRVRWRLIAILPIAIGAGLLPYAYMPLASSTNPPMNWGYAREADGFFFSINRSQYSGSLSDLSVKSLGRLMGTKGETAPKDLRVKPTRPSDLSTLQKAQFWIGFFWTQLVHAFTPLAIIGYFASFLFVFRFSLEKRVWIYFLHLAFVLAAFFQPVTMDPQIDVAGWWLHMPYHTYTNLIFAVLSGLGIGLIINKFSLRRPVFFWLAPALLILPVFTFLGSEASCNQRGRWFGWMFGHDMLKDLPQGSIMIGGTDPGRFVPTYMILGESTQPAKFKRDPDFDRRDLYIITQNALGEPNYMKYLRDQYTTARPEPRNAFERWLGRGEAYPRTPIQLPSEKEIAEVVKQAAKEQGEPIAGDAQGLMVFSSVLKWIWEKNRERHDFFIEESFPILWTYDYALPHGLIYQLSKTKVETLPPHVVAQDFAFWKDYKARLLGDPQYFKDLDARRSFSKLRGTTGNIYRHHKMTDEAMRAYREALELWPNNVETILALMNYLWEQDKFDEVIQLYKTALDHDPNSFDLWRLLGMAERRKETGAEIRALTLKLSEQPKSRETLQNLIQLYANVGDTNKADPLIERALRDFPEDSDLLRYIISYHEQNNELSRTLEPARRLTMVEGSNVENFLLLARAYFLQDKKKEFYETAARAVELGGPSVQEAFRTEPQFSAWTNEVEFKKLTTPRQLPAK